MKRILVTGANKGIGLAVVEGLLRQRADCGVILGSRDPGRGEAARARLLAQQPGWGERLECLSLDVADEASVEAAAASLAERCGSATAPLDGLVNNAGVGSGPLDEVLAVNCYGIERVCRAFFPLLADASRVVNVTSAAGPNFVAQCRPEQRDFFLDEHLTWGQLDAFMHDCLGCDSAAFAARGLGEGRSYGLSKACANALTGILARRHRRLRINACTPGFIETDLGMEFIRGSGRTPQEAGMKTPVEGARVVLHLLADEVQASGQYFGSDCRRSPLDRYRAPGSPEYRGDR